MENDLRIMGAQALCNLGHRGHDPDGAGEEGEGGGQAGGSSYIMGSLPVGKRRRVARASDPTATKQGWSRDEDLTILRTVRELGTKW